MHIVSGPTGERKIRTLLLFLMVAIFAGWFAYDGWWGWPAENLKQHLENLPLDAREKSGSVRLYDSVRESVQEQVKAALQEIDPQAQRAALEKLFGGPPSVEHENDWYYFGPCYRYELTVREGGRRRHAGAAAGHSQLDLLGQKVLAVGLGLLAVYLFWVVLKVRRTRLELDDRGLVYDSVGPIPWEAMQSLDSSRFSKKGYVDLHYDGQGVSRKLRLDEYHLEAFDQVIDAICARKSFENPLPVDEPKAG
jgi:hypothetical protein